MQPQPKGSITLGWLQMPQEAVHQYAAAKSSGNLP
jgi:hypothetical protein